MWLRLRNVEGKNIYVFFLSSSLRIPDPYLLLRVLDPSLLLGDPGFLVNLPRNWLAHNQKLFEKVNILIWLFMFFSQKQRITNLHCPKFSCEIVLEGSSERIANIFWIHGRIFIKIRKTFQGGYFDDQQPFWCIWLGLFKSKASLLTKLEKWNSIPCFPNTSSNGD